MLFDCSRHDDVVTDACQQAPEKITLLDLRKICCSAKLETFL